MVRQLQLLIRLYRPADNVLLQKKRKKKHTMAERGISTREQTKKNKKEDGT